MLLTKMETNPKSALLRRTWAGIPGAQAPAQEGLPVRRARTCAGSNRLPANNEKRPTGLTTCEAFLLRCGDRIAADYRLLI